MISKVVFIFKVVLTVFIFTILDFSFLGAASGNTITIEGKVTDIYNDEETLESFLTINTSSGNYVVDMRTRKSTGRVIELNQNIKIKVRNIELKRGKYICEFVSF